jgi:hypothetical protein
VSSASISNVCELFRVLGIFRPVISFVSSW